MQYNNPEEYKLLKNYVGSVDRGMISPLVGYDKYKEYHDRIQNEIVGLTTSNGITIQGQSAHLLERVFGVQNDPSHGGETRLGVDIEDIKEALTSGKPHKVKPAENRKSQFFSGERAKVSINPDTGIIIQCEPKRKKKG